MAAWKTAAAVGWIWAASLLATRVHDVATYEVIASAPPAWGMVVLPFSTMMLLVPAGALLGWLSDRWPARAWLSAAWIIPLLDLSRLQGVPIPYTFLEPLLLAGLTGEAARHMVHDDIGMLRAVRPANSRRIAMVLAVTAFAWWCHEGNTFYQRYLLGYVDFGQHAVRVASTWEGRGFLRESPGLPAFYDHFNPGLALLAPLWGLWPDARVFIVIQALCLAAPAVIVWFLARRFGASPIESLLWTAAYLCFPTVGQLNVNYSYGWHPVSLALPALFMAFLLAAEARYVAAFACLVLACSFKETVPVVASVAAAALATAAWWRRRNGLPATPLPGRLPWLGWLLLSASLLAGSILVSRWAPFARFQMNKFAHLGSTAVEIALSPITRPGVFWSTVAQPRCAYFLLCLLIPWGYAGSRRGWSLRWALIVPWSVLILMNLPASTSIAFQYTTVLIPVLLLAALYGVYGNGQSRVERSDEAASAAGDRAEPTGSRSTALALSAALSAATASMFFGSLPWSMPTRVLMEYRTYHVDGRPAVDRRSPGSRGHTLIERLVRDLRKNRQTTSLIATGRIAAHLIGVRRLETVSLARQTDRWRRLESAAGEGRSGIECFEWVVLDRLETFQQSAAETAWIAQEALHAGYRVVLDEDGLLVLRRPAP